MCMIHTHGMGQRYKRDFMYIESMLYAGKVSILIFQIPFVKIKCQNSAVNRQCWGKLLLKMHYIALLPTKVTNCITYLVFMQSNASHYVFSSGLGLTVCFYIDKVKKAQSFFGCCCFFILCV